MDLLSTFLFENSHHEVYITSDENNKPFFKASDVGRVLGIKKVSSSIVDFDEDEKGSRITATRGGNQNITFLTKQGVFKLIFRSKKPIAKPFQKWVFNVIDTIERTGEYKLKEEVEEIKSNSQKMVREYKDKEDARLSKIFIDGCQDKTLVYYGKIKTMEDGRMLIKIGCTKDMKVRLHGLKEEFGNMCILNVFECDKQESFENFIHQHIDIKRYEYKEVINDKKKSNEVFCMTQSEYTRAVNIARRNVSRFRFDKKRDID